MQRTFLIVLFSVGTVAGFGSGIASMVHHARMHHACSGWHESSPATNEAR